MKKFRLYFDTDKEVVWLNKMAEAGYALSGYFLGVYTFDKCEPGKYVYQIDYTNGMFRVESSYRDFMNEMGVEIIAVWGPWVYLRKCASEGAFELYSDVESRIEYYEKIRRTFKVAAIIELLGVLLEIFAAFGGVPLGWVFASLLAALATAFIRQCYNISGILADLRGRLGEPGENLFERGSKRRHSMFLSLGFFMNSLGFLPSMENCEMLKGFFHGVAIVFFVAGIIFTLKNSKE